MRVLLLVYHPKRAGLTDYAVDCSALPKQGVSRISYCAMRTENAKYGIRIVQKNAEKGCKNND
jgi:hypothetical protein